MQSIIAPYLFAHSQRIELVGIKMPAAPLYARVADPHRCCGVARPARNGLGRLTADFLRSVRKEIDTVSVPFGESLGRTIIDLTGLLLDATDDDSLTCEAAPYSVMHPTVRGVCGNKPVRSQTQSRGHCPGNGHFGAAFASRVQQRRG
jgi:hypothetical protein